MSRPTNVPYEVLEQLIHDASVGMSLHDHSGRCLVINRALADINGVGIDASLGRMLDEYLPDMAHVLLDAFDRALVANASIDVELVGRTPASPGVDRWFSCQFHPVTLEDGGEPGVAVVVVETTAHRRALAQLADDGRRLQAVFDRIDEGFCVCEMICDDRGEPVDYRFVEVNSLFEQMTGLVDPVGRTALELVPELEPEWIERYGRVALDRETVRFEMASDVMGRSFTVFATPLPGPRSFAIVFRDETERITAQRELVEIATRFRAMADQLPLIVWVHDEHGGQEFVNQTFCDYFGVTRAEMSANRWEVLMHPDDATAYADSFARAVATHSEFHHSTRVRDAHGDWRWIESWARPRFDESGVFRGHIGTSADITDRKMAEQSLEAAIRFTRRVLDTLFTFVGLLSPDGTLLEANRAPLAAAGLTPDDVIGRKFWDCYWWNHDPDVSERLRTAVEQAANGHDVRYDALIRVGAAERMWIDFQIAPLTDDDGNVTHLVPSGLDIGDRMSAERLRAERLEAERHRRERAEFLERNARRLAGVVEVGQVAAVVLEHLKEAVAFDVAAVNVVDDDGRVSIFTVPDVGEESTARFDGAVLTRDLPGHRAIIDDATVHWRDDTEIRRDLAHLDETLRRYTFQSLLALPMRGADRIPVGSLVVAAGQPDAFDDAMVELLGAVADQAGRTLERARLHQQLLAAHQRERTVALRLQRALLPDRVVQHPTLSVSATYRAATEHLDVGGDWYDTYAWASGHVGIVVGDVVGHDLEAAATMGRLRAATAALVPDCTPSAAAMLASIDHLARTLEMCDFVTAACVVVDPSTGEFTWCTAGHPPPLVVDADGSTRWLAAQMYPPLGQIDLGTIVEHADRLRSGGTVVLFTDGLVERRGIDIDVGLIRLERIAGDLAALDNQLVPDELADRMVDDGTADDIVIVSARWNPLAAT